MGAAVIGLAPQERQPDTPEYLNDLPDLVDQVGELKGPGRGRPPAVARTGRSGFRRPVAGVGLVGIVSLAVGAGLSCFVRWPEPHIHDEFSYLLAGDTFAHGRLTNPTHPMWRHFESFHILHEPTYQSKYPAGQGLALALGQVLGDPLAGVWISLALACGAVCWMLQGWMPPRWALAGALVVALHPLILAAWGQTYWGGAVAFLGGALVYGALPRLLRRVRRTDALLFACGLAVLANSRPVEGAIAAMPAVALLVARAARGALVPRESVVRDLLLPVGLALAGCLFFIGYYDWRVTGDPFRLPYQVWWEQYQGPAAVFRHAELKAWRGSSSAPVHQKLLDLREFFFPFALWLPLLALARLWRLSSVRLALTAAVGVVGFTVVSGTGWPHYSAPAAALLFLLVVQGARWAWRIRPKGGRVLVFVVLAFHVAGVAVVQVRREPSRWFRTSLLSRAKILKALEAKPGLDLVIVRYRPGHLVHVEWVYNEADINRAEVIWARDMGAENAELLDYFSYRAVWLLDADAHPPVLRPYGRPRRYRWRPNEGMLRGRLRPSVAPLNTR